MKILIDIGHPAHVHYFRNFIKIMESKGHKFLIIARDKEISQYLLKSYGIDYFSRGKGSSKILGKFVYTFKAVLFDIKLGLKFKPDILLSFASPYAAQASFFLRKPNIIIDDTEKAIIGRFFYQPFTEVVITPKFFYKEIGRKQIRIDSFFELCYLHNKLFLPDETVLKYLGINPDEKYVFLRFVSWTANHDIGQSGIPNKLREELVNTLIDRGYKIFISAEGELSEKLKKYKIKIAPEMIHSVLKFAELFIGESGTMATEAALLGTPSVYVNSIDAGVFQEEVNCGVLYSYRTPDSLLDKIIKLLDNENLKVEHLHKSQNLLQNKINPTNFLIWFIENYPNSAKIMKENPDYQYNFK